MGIFSLAGLDFFDSQGPGSVSPLEFVSLLSLFAFLALLQGGTNAFSVLVSGDIKFTKGDEYRRFTLFLAAQMLCGTMTVILLLSSLNVISFESFRLFFFASFSFFCGVSALAVWFDVHPATVVGLAFTVLLLCGISVVNPVWQPVVYSFGPVAALLVMCVVTCRKTSQYALFFLRPYQIWSFIFLVFFSVQAFGVFEFRPSITLGCMFVLVLLQWGMCVSSLWATYTENVEERDREHKEDALEEKRKLEAIFRDMHDEITGCPNDSFLVNYLNERVCAGDLSSFALFCVRVRGLRPVQNALGIETANGLLKSCAQRLAVIGHAIEDFISISDHDNKLGCVIRSEGREFFMISQTSSPAAIQRLCDKINETFSVPFEHGGLCLDLQANIGVSLFPDHGCRPQLVMQHANVAVDIAKRGSYESILFDPLLDPSVQRRLILLGDLRGALNRGDIYMTYQPQVSLVTGQVVGVEALIRWKHPFLGQVPPDEFVTLAEQTGMIKHLSRWVCDHAAMDFVRLSLEGVQLKMSINVSPNNLLEDTFASSVLAILQEYDIPKGYFCVELTETAVMLDPERVMASIEYLTRHGVVFSIDDFGTGFSSLVNLKRLKVKQLKIDKGFIANLEFDTEDEAIVRATIEMAHCLGVQTVAEGVETLAVLDKLKALGCNIIQGFYISKSVPIDELVEWLASRPNQTLKLKHLVS